MEDRFDTFYAVRVERRDHSKPLTRRPIYINDRERFGPVNRARQFTTIAAAEAHIRARGDRDRYRFLVELCTRERQHKAKDPNANFLQQLMDIPYPYRRTAYNWVRGRDVAALLRRESEEVYQRHRRVLADHGLDVTRPSPVVIMKPRRGKFKINVGDTPPARSPKRYFVPRSERPSAAPEPLHVDAPREGDADTGTDDSDP